MRNISGQQVENEQQWIKKCEQEHMQKKLLVSIYDISYIRWVTRTFHVVVVQNNVKEMYKKCAARARLYFFANKTNWFFSRSRCRRRLALHDLIFLFE